MDRRLETTLNHILSELRGITQLLKEGIHPNPAITPEVLQQTVTGAAFANMEIERLQEVLRDNLSGDQREEFFRLMGISLDPVDTQSHSPHQ